MFLYRKFGRSSASRQHAVKRAKEDRMLCINTSLKESVGQILCDANQDKTREERLSISNQKMLILLFFSHFAG